MTGFPTHSNSDSASFDSKDISSNVKYVFDDNIELSNLYVYQSDGDGPQTDLSITTGNNWFIINQDFDKSGYIRIQAQDNEYNYINPVIITGPNNEVPYVTTNILSSYITANDKFSIDANGQAYKAIADAPITGNTAQFYQDHNVFFPVSALSSNIEYTLVGFNNTAQAIGVSHTDDNGGGDNTIGITSGSNNFIITGNIPSTGLLRINVFFDDYAYLNPVVLSGTYSNVPYVTKNEMNYIPYSASGVELPNSNFSIDASGQAYKTVESSPMTGSAMFSYTAQNFFPVDNIKKNVKYSLIGSTANTSNSTIQWFNSDGSQDGSLDAIKETDGFTITGDIPTAAVYIRARLRDDNYSYISPVVITDNSIEEMPYIIATAVPSNTGTYVLKCIDGVIQWVAES